MPDLEALAAATCRQMTVPQLKAACRWRGFDAPKGGKEELAEFVAARLLEPIGAGPAMASLSTTWLLVLHRIALDGAGGTILEAVAPIVFPGMRSYHVDLGKLFRSVGDGLVNRGVVLWEDRSSGLSRSRSRYLDLRLHLPPGHLAALPPFPVGTRPLGRAKSARDWRTFFREALQVWAAGAQTTMRRKGRCAASSLQFTVARRHAARYHQAMSHVVKSRSIQVELPEEVFGARPWNPEELAEELRILWLVEQVRERRIGSGKAAELAEVPLARFLKVLGRHGVPVYDYDPGELEAELATLP